jgi:hypothetical protein
VAEWLRPAAKTRPRPRTTAATMDITSVLARAIAIVLVIFTSPIPSHPTDGFQLCSVGLLARGSLRFPCLPSFPVAFWGTLAAYSRGGGCGIGPPDGIRPYRIPGYPLTLCVLGEAPNAPLCDFDSTFVKADSRHIRWAKRRKSKGNLRGKIRYFVDNLPKSAICGVVSLTLGHKGRHTTGQSESYEFTA